jgi:threonine dehydrogenase-like Zn-dependent dehydrogenase
MSGSRRSICANAGGTRLSSRSRRLRERPALLQGWLHRLRHNPGAEARRRGLKIKFVRRIGDDFPRAIDLVTSGRANVRAMVTHREGPNAAPDLFESLAQNHPAI